MNMLNPEGIRWWNFSRPEDEDFTLEVTGTVVAIQLYQTRDQAKMPEVWPDNNPKTAIRMLMADFLGDPFIVRVTRKTKRNKDGAGKLHMDLGKIAGPNFKDLIGKTLRISTKDAVGAPYGIGNARPFEVELQSVEPFKPKFSIPEEWEAEIHMASMPATMPGTGLPQGYQEAPTQTYQTQPPQAPPQPQQGGYPQQPPQQQGYQQAPQQPGYPQQPPQAPPQPQQQQPPQGGYTQLDDGTPIDPITGQPIY